MWISFLLPWKKTDLYPHCFIFSKHKRLYSLVLTSVCCSRMLVMPPLLFFWLDHFMQPDHPCSDVSMSNKKNKYHRHHPRPASAFLPERRRFVDTGPEGQPCFLFACCTTKNTNTQTNKKTLPSAWPMIACCYERDIYTTVEFNYL